MQRHTVQNLPLVTALQRDLDRGEAESIALALELRADLILLDEQEGRHAAQHMGLSTTGVVGILLEAKVSGHVASVRPHLDALRNEAGFFLSEALCQEILRLAGEAVEEHHHGA
jgi:predicted nucleic acid-binding protein